MARFPYLDLTQLRSTSTPLYLHCPITQLVSILHSAFQYPNSIVYSTLRLGLSLVLDSSCRYIDLQVLSVTFASCTAHSSSSPATSLLDRIPPRHAPLTEIMFSNLTNIVQKAQQLIDPTQGLNLSSSDRNPSKSSLFQSQFRLPASQTPLYEINAELTIPPSNATHGDKDHDRGWHYAGKLHLSEHYMCFSTTPTSFVQSASLSTSTAFTGQTHGGGPSGNGFTFPLCAIRRVERLNSQNFQVCGASGLGDHVCYQF